MQRRHKYSITDVHIAPFHLSTAAMTQIFICHSLATFCAAPSLALFATENTFSANKPPPRTRSTGVYRRAVCFGDTIHFYVKTSHNHLCLLALTQALYVGHLSKKAGGRFAFLTLQKGCSFPSK